MNPWIEAMLLLVLAMAGGITAAATRWLGRRAFLGVAAVSLLLLGMVILGRRYGASVLPPAWAVALGSPRATQVLAILLPLALLTPGLRLPHRRGRAGVAAFLLLALGQVCIGPALSAGWVSGRLGRLGTRWSSDGVCLQGTDFTCGPAAAVTGLMRLGIGAEEGDLARRARSSPLAGTPPGVLAGALREAFGADGLDPTVATGAAARACLGETPVLVVVRFGPLLDHWWCVLERAPGGWWVADPLEGIVRVSAAEFDRRWRGVAVVLRRPGVAWDAKIRPAFPKMGREPRS